MAGRTAPAVSMRSTSRRFIFPPGFECTGGTLGARAADGKFASVAQFLHGIAQGMEFHGDIAGITQFGELAENVGIVDFTGAGVVAAGNVRNVDDGDEIDVFFELGDKITGGNLLVEEIVEKLDVGDRKSTRLNSSHTVISYAVFCLKKKKKRKRKNK